jgi:tetratricopeptide (TPR) repeat protein
MNSKTETFMINIHGMITSRNKCDDTAKELLPEKLMDEPELASFEPPLLIQPASAGSSLSELLSNAVPAKEAFDSAIAEWIATKQNCSNPPTLTTAPLKSPSRCAEKIKDDYDGAYNRLCDVVRCTIVVHSEQHLSDLLHSLLAGSIECLKVVRLKNRFATPMFTGIRDCLLNVSINGTHVGEIQLHFGPILALKPECHIYYEFFRDYFVGTAQSYKERMEVFEKLGDVGENGVANDIKAILEGDDLYKLDALWNCAQYTLLGDGELATKAALRIEALKKEKPEYHPCICDICQSNTMRGIRYKCKTCHPSYDVCEECFPGVKNHHDGEHEFEEVSMETGNLVPFAMDRLKLASGYTAEGKYKEAIEILQGVLAKLGDDHQLSSITQNNLGMLYRLTGNPQKAIDIYQRSLGRAIDDAFIQTVANMGVAYMDLGQKEKCLELCEMSLEKYGEGVTLGSLAVTNNAAVCLKEMGRIDEAMPFYEKCLRGSEQLHGKDHSRTKMTMDNMSVAYRANGDFEKALALGKKTLKLYEEGPDGVNHPDTLMCLGNVAKTYLEMERFDEAMEHIGRCVDGLTRRLGASHPATQYATEIKAECSQKMQKTKFTSRAFARR